LRQDQVEREPMVRKGDLVQVLAESSVLRVSTQAVAQEHGCAGDRILLLNVNSKKNIYGRVVDGQTVKVEF
jgi:flagella basal body P-ring formation protein FlgA